MATPRPERGPTTFPDAAHPVLQTRRPGKFIFISEQAAKQAGAYFPIQAATQAMILKDKGLGIPVDTIKGAGLSTEVLTALGSMLEQTLMSKSPIQTADAYERALVQHESAEDILEADLLAQSHFGAIELLHVLHEDGVVIGGPFNRIRDMLMLPGYIEQLTAVESRDAQEEEQETMIIGLGGTLIPKPRRDPDLDDALQGWFRDQDKS